MLILGIHSDWQDAGVALFDEYRPVAALPLSRVTGLPHDGGLPAAAIAECLAIAGVHPADIGGVALHAGIFPGRYFRGMPFSRRVGRGLRALFGRNMPMNLPEEARRGGQRELHAVLDTTTLLGDLELNRNIPVRFYARSMAQALLPLWHAETQESLVFTLSHMPGEPAYRSRLLRYGRLADADSGDMESGGLAGLLALAVEGLGLPDESALFALASYGEPVLAHALLAHIHVDPDGRIATDFSSDGGPVRWLRRLAEGHPAETLAASLSHAVEETLAIALGRQAKRLEVGQVVLGGALLCEPLLLHRIATRLRSCSLVGSPAGEGALPMGGVLNFLLERDGMEKWLAQRRDWPAVAAGRDYTADIDPVLGNAGCRLVSQDPQRGAAALLNAGKIVACYGGQCRGLEGDTARQILFAGDQVGRFGEVNRRLDRPEFMSPVIWVPDERSTALLLDAGSQTAPFGRGGTIMGKLNPVLRGRFAALLSPDLLCQIRSVSGQQEPHLVRLLGSYGALSGLPALPGLPMRIGAGPLLDAPSEVLRLLSEGRVDYVATEQAVWERG